MKLLSTALLTSASFGALAIATPALAQTSQPALPGGDACQVPADQRQPGVTCPPADCQALAGSSTRARYPRPLAATTSSLSVRAFAATASTPPIRSPSSPATRPSTSGFSSTAEALQSVGVTGGTGQINDTFGGLVVNGGPGVNTLSLRGLGPTRTLVLLNGRRLSPAGTRGSVGAADLNVLPNAILDRIEVLNTGASSVYGSDAVAGVVNIVTLKKFNGIALEANVSVPEIGNGIEQRYAITAGASGDRWSVMGSLEYYKRTRITLGDQPWARCPQQLRLSGVGTAKGSGDYIDPRTGQPKCFPLEEGGVTVNTIGTNFTLLPNGSPVLAPGFEPVPPPNIIAGVPSPFSTYCTRWRPNASQTAGPLPGFECVGGFFYNANGPGRADNQLIGTNTNLRDTSSAATLRQDIISPSKSYIGYLSGDL